MVLAKKAVLFTIISLFFLLVFYTFVSVDQSVVQRNFISPEYTSANILASDLELSILPSLTSLALSETLLAITNYSMENPAIDPEDFLNVTLELILNGSSTTHPGLNITNSLNASFETLQDLISTEMGLQVTFTTSRKNFFIFHEDFWEVSVLLPVYFEISDTSDVGDQRLVWQNKTAYVHTRSSIVGFLDPLFYQRTNLTPLDVEVRIDPRTFQQGLWNLSQLRDHINSTGFVEARIDADVTYPPPTYIDRLLNQTIASSQYGYEYFIRTDWNLSTEYNATNFVDFLFWDDWDCDEPLYQIPGISNLTEFEDFRLSDETLIKYLSGDDRRDIIDGEANIVCPE
ncbi:MAG: hypothetical protein ACMXYF_05435 [Candidatus Woesearchaeota archaeon]